MMRSRRGGLALPSWDFPSRRRSTSGEHIWLLDRADRRAGPMGTSKRVMDVGAARVRALGSGCIILPPYLSHYAYADVARRDIAGSVVSNVS